ncbi:uncharacterized protein [Spinacia oleracea]|uniref:Uncharacterized protein n=1 Tax=Spinacia oleracea TaxID=3562 RepID=A0ABM3R502_SPIOL|nr:uncharacterized protein LOC130465949 [Spinacia oleracea]
MVKKAAAKKVVEAPKIDNVAVSNLETAIEGPRTQGQRPNQVSDEIPVAKQSVTIKKKKKTVSLKTKDNEVEPEREAVEGPELSRQIVLQNSSLIDVPVPDAHQLQAQAIKEVGVDGLPIMFTFVTQCSGGTLCKLIKDFTPEQKAVVEEIGFGGLLELQLNRKNTQMMYWCIKCFDGVSSLFTVSDSKQFEITDYDV